MVFKMPIFSIASPSRIYPNRDWFKNIPSDNTGAKDEMIERDGIFALLWGECNIR
jgi:hypothetical protein